MTPEGIPSSLTPPLPIAIQVRGQDTVFNAIRIIFSNSEKQGFRHGVDVKWGAKAVLTSSYFEDISVALYVDDGVIEMTHAVIEGRGAVVIASGERSRVALVSVHVETNSNHSASFLSRNGAEIGFSDGAVYFKNNSAFSSEWGGDLF
ncbi:hypothetical protein [Candidatus Bartonella washoeensis]|uniref:Uncharacterized protein n=1 Tax=Cardidatus Bartonella washoeensis 085-0475 TaxID=1094564 RepID=J1JGP1_9HYPH|nr:hypothetical protein MCW_01379 [Bartonella washoeensis 085-0475]